MNRIAARILLTHKIAAISATGALGLAIVGAIYLFGASVQDRYRQVADRSQSMLTLAGNLGVNLLENRRAEKDFLLRNDLTYVERHGNLKRTITEQIDALQQQANAAGLDSLARRIELIGAGYERYVAHFAAMVDAKRRLGLNENLGLEGALRTSVHAIESKLTGFDQPRLLATMLMMRRHEKDFMLRRDPKYGGDMKKRASEFVDLLDKTEIPSADKDDIKQRLAAYQKDFFAWMDVALVVAKEQAATSEAYAAIEPAIDEMLNAVKETYAQADSANQESRTSTKSKMLVAILLITIVVCGFGFWIGRSVARPIRSMTDAMRKLADGDNDIKVTGAERGDEIGSMARAMLVFRDGAIERGRLERAAVEQRQLADEERRRNEQARAAAAREVETVVNSLGAGLERLASGDLAFRLGEGFSDAYLKTRDDFNAAMTRLQETIGMIATATREVSNAARESSASTTDLSQRTEKQAASLEQTSASMEVISAIVRKNAENAQRANQLASGTRQVADHGGTVVAQAVQAMSRIEQSSARMSDIIAVIDEIARQTNLLALNAAVEAARAGEAGRGFAVVASEVRSLAQRSSQAAKDIKDLIANSATQVREGVELVNRAGGSLTDILESIKQVAAIVSEIADASSEQAAGLDRVNNALWQMDEMTQQNSALVEESAATVKALEQQSDAMREHVDFFRTADDAQAAPQRPAKNSRDGSPARQARAAAG